MFRTLFVIAALFLSGCASYGSAQYGDRTPVYRDGSYYSPSASGYGDYYYAPEYRYDHYEYYDHFGYGYGYPYGFGDRYCSFRYRPCGYGSRWGSGWGLSLFFGRGWSNWYGWPYYGGWHHHHHDWDRHHDWRRDRDWDRDRGRDRGRGDDRPTAPPGDGGNDNGPPVSSTPWPMPDPGARRPPGTRTPWPVRDPTRDPGSRNPGYRDEAPTPRELEGDDGVWTRDPNAGPRRGVGVRPAPPPRDRNVGDWQVQPQPQPQPRAPLPRDRSDDDGDSPPPPPRRERSNRGDDRDVQHDDEPRPALQ